MLVDLLSYNYIDTNIQELLHKFMWRSFNFSRSRTSFIFLPIACQSVSNMYFLFLFLFFEVNYIIFTRWTFFSYIYGRLIVLLIVLSFVEISLCTHFVAFDLLLIVILLLLLLLLLLELLVLRKTRITIWIKINSWNLLEINANLEALGMLIMP